MWAELAGGAAGAGLALGARGLLHPRAALFGPVVWRGPASRPWVALTFDDGPHPRYTAQVAETLAHAQARATFFCLGAKLAREPALGRELLAAGHELANHTHTHGTGRDLFSARRLTEDLGRAQAVLQEVTGQACTRYRPAVGIRNPVVHAAARAHGLSVVTWSQAARDGLFPLTESRARSLAEHATPGNILALHDGIVADTDASALRAATVRQLPILLAALQARGLVCVTLSQLLASDVPQPP